MKQRHPEIDTLRGLACIALVIAHVIGLNNVSGLRLPDDHGLRLFNSLFAYLRMPLFAFLSGYVYALRPMKDDAAGFIQGKVRRLLVPMLLVGTLFAVLQANTPGANFTARQDWTLLHIKPVAHYWFLEALFVVFLAIVAMERRGWLSSAPGLAAIWAAAAALFIGNPLPSYFGLSGATYLLPYVLLGIGCHRFTGRFTDAQVRRWSVMVLCAVIALAVLFSARLPRTDSAVALVIGSSACALLLRTRMRFRWLARVGVHSFSIYLFHSMFSAASRILLAPLHDVPTGSLLVFGVAAGLAGPIVLETMLLRSRHPAGLWMLGVRRVAGQGPARESAAQTSGVAPLMRPDRPDVAA